MGELSTLARDLLIRMTAPEGGEALLSGGYDAAAMDSLSALASPQRLIHISTLLQSTAAGLSLSANRRTDAELCLLRLCDDSLCGDLTALVSRVKRLEEQLSKNPRPTAAPAAPAGGRKQKAAAAEPSPIMDDIPWEAPPAPIMDDVPWEAPPAPKTPDPPEDFAAAPMPAAAERTAVPADDGTARAADGDLWDRLIDAYQGRLPAMYRAFLDGARGKLEGDLLTVVCGSDFTEKQLHNVKVQSVLQEVTSAALDRPIAVAFTVGEMPKPRGGAPASGGDKLDDLINFGSQFDNFKVK